MSCNFFSVPDERLRAGDFSQALNTNGSLQLIYDPGVTRHRSHPARARRSRAT